MVKPSPMAKLYPPPPPPPPRHLRTPAKPSSTAAVITLVFGILGFCVPILAIAAIICGHICVSDTTKTPGGRPGRGMALGGLTLGYLGLIVWGICIMVMVVSSKKSAAESASLFPVRQEPIPAFPALPEFTTLEPSGVRVGQVRLQGSGPGGGMTLRVYLPAGESPAKGSLPCVLTAPAGSNLLQGNGVEPLDEDAYHDESLPYAEAGMVVVLYSIDGETGEAEEETENVEAMSRAYEEFRAAQAGVVNGRNALEFALARLPMVDRGRIYSAGHSSAGTLSLLLAAHENRLKGCIAYAPCGDVSHFHERLLSESGLSLYFKDIRSFLKRSSPVTHLASLDLPVFLFQSKDDTVARYAEAQAFYQKAKQVASERALPKSDLTFKVVPEGGHYDSMIEAGIPAAIDWIKEH